MTTATATPQTEQRYCKAVYVGTKAMDDGQQVYVYRATTEALDRQGEIVTLDGWETANYERNPVILDSHRYDGIENIVGRGVHLERVDGAIEVGIAFSQNNPRGVLAKGLADEGMLNAVSVGFKPIEMDRGNGKEPLKHTRKELLEISVVGVPANHEALRVRGLDGDDGKFRIEIDNAKLLTEQDAEALAAKVIAAIKGNMKGLAGGVVKPEPDPNPTTKLVDFSGALTERQREQDLYETRWELESALSRVLHEALADTETSDEELIALVDRSLEQYHEAIVAWFRAARAAGIGKDAADVSTLKTMGEALAEIKAGRTLSTKNEKLLRQAAGLLTEADGLLQNVLSAIEPEQGGKSHDPEGGEAADTGEPVLAVDVEALKGLQAFVGQE